MKIKKYYLVLMIIIIGFTACNKPINNIKNPKDITTQTIKELQKDTVLISLSPDKKYLYIFDKEINIKYKTIQYTKDNIEINNKIFGILLIILISLIAIIIIII